MLERFKSFLFFMKYMPYYTLFLFTLFTGTLISLSSNHWIYVWIGFEINLLSFIPIILQSNNNQETEAAVKYFLIQALGSAIILLSSISILLQNFSIFSYNSIIYTLIFALMIKIGAAPFHFWLPQIIIRVKWTTCMILATWQKIAPLFIVITSSSMLTNKLLITIAITRTITGAIGGLNQTHLRPLLAYSSIGHLGWIIARASISALFTLTYFIIYSLMTLTIIITVLLNTMKRNYISSVSNISLTTAYSLIILFLSLGGLPPLLGFLPKWILIKTIINQNILLFISIIIIRSLIRLFYYLSIFFNIFINHAPNIHTNKNSTSIITNLSLISTSTLGIVPLIL